MCAANDGFFCCVYAVWFSEGYEGVYRAYITRVESKLGNCVH